MLLLECGCWVLSVYFLNETGNVWSVERELDGYSSFEPKIVFIGVYISVLFFEVVKSGPEIKRVVCERDELDKM